MKKLTKLGYRLLPQSVRPLARRSYDALIGEPGELTRYYRNNLQPPSKISEKLESRYHWFMDNIVHRMSFCRQVSYLTHLPVLLALAQQHPLRRVLELGSGMFSTLAFLDRENFPDLVQLDSIESDPEWARKVVEAARGDARLDLRVISGAVADAVKQLDLNTYDLIFVDDSVTTGERSRTIRTLTEARGPVVVIHDFDMPVYRDASRDFTHRFRFRALTPNTGVVWNDAGVNRDDLESVNSLIKSHYKDIPLEDSAAFQNWLKGTLKNLLRSGTRE